MKINDDFGFYAVLTDPVAGYAVLTELLVKHGVSYVQLRMKGNRRQEVLQTAHEMRAVTRGSATRLIINDFADIAAEIGADGVHVGQGDLPYAQARAVAGPQAVIGVSTSSSAQMREACLLHPDYVGIGPVFPTSTKPDADPAIGLDGTADMLKAATVPAVLIGGITIESLPALFQTGARNFCMMGDLMKSSRPEDVLKRILDAYHECVAVIRNKP